MANLKACDYGGCPIVGRAGKGEALQRVSEEIFLPGVNPKNPFRSMTVLWHLCPEHAPAAREWASRVGGQADFSVLNASTIGATPEVPEEPS